MDLPGVLVTGTDVISSSDSLRALYTQSVVTLNVR